MATSDRPDTAAQDALWGDTIVRREGDGVPFLVYEPRPRSLHDMLQTGLRWQERTHLVHLGERLTFAGVAERADAVAAALHSRGVAAGDRVMLIGTNSIDYVTTFWGIVAAGAVVVLGNGWWSAAEVDHARTVSEPTLILSSMTRPIPGAISLEEITSEQAVDSAAIGQGSPAYPAHEDDAAVILFTSGSTGAPKGAVLSHRACIALQHTLMHITRRLPGQLGADHPADINRQTGPLFHIGGVQALVRAWLLGGTLILPAGRFDPAEVVDLIERERVVRWGGVPTMISRVLAVPGIEERDLTSLRSLTLGGSTVSPELIERTRVVFPNAASGVTQIYGLSEAGGTLTVASAKDLAARPGTVGRALPVVELEIRSSGDDGVGEIFARSPAQMSGYYGTDDDPTQTTDAWIATGDLGRIVDGYLYLTGRSKDLIIRGGENIAAAHVEANLTRHPAVREVAVVALPDADLGEIVAAAVRLDDGDTTTIDDLIATARQQLAYFEVPSRWWVRTTELPTNQAGKIDKPALRRTFPDAPRTDERTPPDQSRGDQR